MRALWLEQQQLTLRNNQPRPPLPPGEAVIKIRLAGICATDLELCRGYYPYCGIPGHEFVGEIVTLPDPSDLSETAYRPGQRVVGEINAICGHCTACRNGRPTHCEQRTVLGIKNRHGAFADYCTLPLTNLIPVPDSISDQQAVFAEPLAAALEIQQQIAIHPDDSVLIIGAGRLGQLIAQTIRLNSCQLTVVARHARQRELLEENNINWIDETQVTAKQYDIVIEATGHESGFALACQAIRPRGTVVLKSTHRNLTTVNLSALVVDEIQLIGSRCGPMRPALRLLEQQLIDPLPLIDASYPLDQAVQAFDHAARPGALKIVLAVNSD